MGDEPRVEPFRAPADDPLAAEHEAVSQWVEDATRSPYGQKYIFSFDLKLLPSGAALLEGEAALAFLSMRLPRLAESHS